MMMSPFDRLFHAGLRSIPIFRRAILLPCYAAPGDHMLRAHAAAQARVHMRAFYARRVDALSSRCVKMAYLRRGNMDGAARLRASDAHGDA